ncbi:MAG: hypothetical protein JW963_22535 [Anaerolineales bacterium]|nr:hypothetical protein [Anaerolineales bacterium]
MKTRRFAWEWLLALILGFGLGLAYAWVLSPVKYVDAEPVALRDNFKDHFRSAIAAAFASNNDLERARARLSLLGDPDPTQALTAQAQRMLAAGEAFEAVQQVAMLSSALQGGVVANSPTAIPTDTQEPAGQSSAPSTSTAEASLPTIQAEPTGTPIPVLTPTLRLTHTPTPTLGAPFQLVGQDTICDPELAEGLLQIVVINATRRQIPGAEIILTWSSGEEHIFTGLKPELGHGYADYLMTPDVMYSIRMADGGTPASGISPPTCTATDDSTYLGGIKITFQQP